MAEVSATAVGTPSQIPDEQRLWKGAVPPVQTVDSMPLSLFDDDNDTTRHTYYLLRHGRSTANVDEIISSDRESLAYTDKHGLTATGYQQGYDSAKQLLDELTGSTEKGDTVVFVSSPFARARQTAQACLEGLFTNKTNMERWKSDLGLKVLPQIYYHDLLLERYFGRLDGEAIYTYAYVWPLDKMNVTHTAFDVESVAAVCTRLKRLVRDLEQQSFATNDDDVSDDRAESAVGRTHVVLVSHADVLQILQLYAANVPNVGEFSSYRFANAEIRRMEVGKGVQSLPSPVPLEAPQRGTGM